jgi:hypothetical protein
MTRQTAARRAVARGMVGLRVQTRGPLDRACILIPAGMAGTIVEWPESEAAGNCICVRLDRYVPGLEHWDNEVLISAEDDVYAYEHEGAAPSMTRAFAEAFEAEGGYPEAPRRDEGLALDETERAMLARLLDDPFTYATSRLSTPVEKHTAEMLADEEIREQLLNRVERPTRRHRESRA